MRALSMLGAGAQPWSSSVCTVHQDRLAYASTVAIYIYQREGRESGYRDWRLRAILTEHHTAVRALAWHPARDTLLASAAADFRICVWCVKQQRVVATLIAPSEPSLLKWNPFEREMISFLHLECRALLTWSAQEGNSKLTAYREHSHFSSGAVCLSWHPTKPGRLAFGHTDGSLSFYNADGSVQLHVRLEKIETDEGEVRTVKWDPLAEDYLLVAHEGGALRLVAVQPPSVPTTLATFRHPASCHAYCISWLPQCPGMFVTGDDESGVVRVWTVGRDTSLENRALQGSGVRAVLVVPGGNEEDKEELDDEPTARASLACVFSDGGLGVYDLRRATWEMHKDAGHTETVFTCAFRPDDTDMLATGSFDGSVKFWCCSSGDLKLHSSTPGRESIVYSVSWAPSPLNFIAAATARTGVLIIDTCRARVTQRLSCHGAGVNVYCVAWCQADARRIASGGDDNTCLVTQHKGEIEVQRCKHPAPVFGCDWQGRDLLATGCEDGNVRVFKVTCLNNEKPIVLSGHIAKVFNVRWSPAMKGLLASGSDDGSVRVWDVTSQSSVHELKGHVGPVRGLAWSPALPHLLISGAWDFSVRVWDVRKGECLALEKDHGADVYGLSVHPLRPLLMASCSRDSTVRLWTLAPLVTILSISALVTEKPLQHIIVNDFKLSNDWPVRLCGPVAAHLRTILDKENLDSTQKLLAVMDTLNADPSVRNLWDLIAVLRGTKEMSQLSRHYPRGIVHASHVSVCHLADGTRLEEGAGCGSRGELALRSAAGSFLKAGALRRYCEIMARLGDWDRALAVAPGVSLKYWRQIAQRRQTGLISSENEQVLPYALALGNVEGVVSFYAARGQLEEAFALSSLGGHMTQDHVEDEEMPSLKNSSPPRLMSVTARALAERHLHAGSPVRAACVLLAVGDKQGALHVLLRGHELELVVALGRALDLQSDVTVHRALALLALRARRLKEWRLARQLIARIDHVQTRQHEALRLLVRFPGSVEERSSVQDLAGVSDSPECMARARTLLSNRNCDHASRTEATKLLLAAGQIDQALNSGLPLIPEMLKSGNDWNPEEALRLTELLQETETSSSQLRAISAYVGCHFVVKRRYPRYILTSMIEHASSLIEECGMSCGLREDMLQGLLDDKSELITRLKQDDEVTWPDRGSVHVSGCQLPAHSALRRCMLTGEPITGSCFALDETGEHFMSASDAIMWAKCGSMSPLGAALNPF